MCIRDRVSRGENYENIIENSGDKILVEIECINGMLTFVDESERKWRENIQVEELQGVNFSRDVVVGGEEKLSLIHI